MADESSRMQSDWDERARVDALSFIETTCNTADRDAFFAAGEQKAERVIDPELNNWCKYSLDDGTAVDIGCGVGRMTRALASRFDHVIGIDVSEEMISRARTLNGDHENVEFYSTDGKSYPDIDTDAVDFVFSYEVFQHFPTLTVVTKNLAEIARVLAPGGRACIHFEPPTSVTLFGMFDFPTRYIRYVPGPLRQMYAFLDKRTLDSTLTMSGTWTGVVISPSEWWRNCAEVSLDVQYFRPDPTHDVGERFFCIAEA